MVRRSKTMKPLFMLMAILGIMLLASAAAWADTLAIDYSSGSEKKVVVTGPVLTTDQERVFTESELKQLFADDKAKGDLYRLTMINTVLSKRAYTVRAVSMWDIFTYCGIPRETYRNPENFLQVISTDGFYQTIGPGVSFSGQGGVTEAGTLAAPRYSYSYHDPEAAADKGWGVTNEYVASKFPTDEDPEPDNPEGDRREVPWLLGFAESVQSVRDGVTGTGGATFFPVDGTDTSQALRPYFGQMYVTNQNLPFSANGTYRVVFAEKRLSASEFYSIPSRQAFSLNGAVVDRAHILTGPADSSVGRTLGQKVKGRYEEDGGNATFFEGTSLESILLIRNEYQYINGGWAYAPVYAIGPGQWMRFENAAGEEVLVRFEEAAANHYTLVYRTGVSAEEMGAIEREIGGKKYYFDLYRDGAPAVQNVSGVFLAESPVPVYVLGDANMDGRINGSDIIAIRGHLTGANPLSGTELLAADANKDGRINGSDIIAVRGHLTGANPLY